MHSSCHFLGSDDSIVVGRQVELDSMTAKHIADVFSVADEFERTQGRALRNTAVYRAEAVVETPA